MSNIRMTISSQSASSGEMQNVYYFNMQPNVPAIPTSAERLAFSERMLELVNPLLPALDNTTNFFARRVELWDNTAKTWNLYAESSLVGLAGSLITDAVSGGVAGLVSASLVGGGRSGRKFIGGLSEDVVQNGNVVGAGITALIDFGLAWITGFTSTNGYIFYTQIFRVATEAFIPMGVTFAVDTIASYQRRRKPGVGI